MAVKGIFYVLVFSSNLERSKKFYRDTLGWELGTDEYGIAGFSFGTGYLVVHEDNRPAGQRSYGGGMHITATVDDAKAEHARLKGLGFDTSKLEWPAQHPE
jgi:catechol 2,3-dioxygenase-like lactoylglutathione lyase family enzyme